MRVVRRRLREILEGTLCGMTLVLFCFFRRVEVMIFSRVPIRLFVEHGLGVIFGGFAALRWVCLEEVDFPLGAASKRGGLRGGLFTVNSWGNATQLPLSG